MQQENNKDSKDGELKFATPAKNSSSRRSSRVHRNVMRDSPTRVTKSTMNRKPTSSSVRRPKKKTNRGFAKSAPPASPMVVQKRSAKASLETESTSSIIRRRTSMPAEPTGTKEGEETDSSIQMKMQNSKISEMVSQQLALEETQEKRNEHVKVIELEDSGGDLKWSESLSNPEDDEESHNEEPEKSMNESVGGRKSLDESKSSAEDVEDVDLESEFSNDSIIDMTVDSDISLNYSISSSVHLDETILEETFDAQEISLLNQSMEESTNTLVGGRDSSNSSEANLKDDVESHNEEAEESKTKSVGERKSLNGSKLNVKDDGVHDACVVRRKSTSHHVKFAKKRNAADQ